MLQVVTSACSDRDMSRHRNGERMVALARLPLEWDHHEAFLSFKETNSEKNEVRGGRTFFIVRRQDWKRRELQRVRWKGNRVEACNAGQIATIQDTVR